VSFGLVRTKVVAAHPKIATIVSAILLTSFFVSIPVPANANNCVTSSTTASNGDTIVTFATEGSCNWQVPTGISSVRVLVVGGGGSGGGGISGSWFGAGGGGGAVVDNQSFTVTAGATISVTVGAGGIKSNYSTTYTGSNFDLRSGSPSAFGSITAGGGKSAINSTPAGGVSGNGRAGGTGAGGTWGNGGAGAAAAGTNINPGAGVTSDISGTSLEYGGGGNGNNGGSTGTARDGAGSRDVAALANRGGGGSNMPSDSYNGGAGGSGVVIVRYAIPAGFSALSFDSNGGTGSKNSIFASTGSSATVPDATGFTNQGFEFVGWYTNRNGTGGTEYSVGSSITLSSDITLFAQWTRLPAPSCAAGVGRGGSGTSNFNTTRAGNGCVGISYKVSGVTTVATFNYTGTDQSWTVPTGVTGATFYLIGAGGGGGIQAGGGGGYATGTYSSLTTGQVLTVIVGQGGGGVASATRPGVSGYPGQYTPTTYGGGGRGGSYGGATANWFASGGGRSAIRLANATEIATAAGGGGGAYGQCGFGGGGTSGLPTTASGNSGTGGTQTAGGTGGISNNGYPGTVGAAFQGGDSRDEGGGGGGGYFGGGGGGDNAGGPGGSSYIALLSNALTTAGGNCGAAALTTGLIYVVSYDANTATSGAVPSNSTVSVGGGTLTLASNSGTLAKTNYTFSGWNTAANGSGATYSVGATTFSPSGDTTLYAQWNSTITYDANGATGTVPTAVVTKGSASATFALNSGSGLTRTGLSFVGWNTVANGSGTLIAGGGSYTSTGNATLFAIFRPTYTYNANGATGGTVPASTLGPIPGTQCFTDPGFNNCRVISYTGTNQTFTIPSDIDVTKGIMVEAWGAGGGGTFAYYGDPSGGAGGYSKAKINSPTAGGVLTVIVGQGGLVRDTTTKFGGGGAAGTASGANLGSSGGGYSGVFSGSGTSTPILISGGGGGGSPGTDSTGTPGGGGAASTTSTVQNGGQSSATNAALAGGRGGTSTAGGAGGTSNNCATAGSSLLGGTGCAISGAEGGGGGGGGYFGGGGGAYQTSTSGINGGGGGGSGFLNTTLATSVSAVKGPDGVYANFAYPDRTSPNYASNAGRGGMPNTNTAADNTGGNGLVTIQWSSPTTSNPVAENTGNLVKTGYRFVGWNTTADGYGTSVPAGTTFPSSTSATLFAAWEPDNTGLTPSFNTNTSSPIGVLANTAYVINTVYTNNANDLVLSQYADKIQIIATVPSGTLAITTTTNLTLPTGYQSALNTAAGTISFVGNLADVNTALATLRYTAAATAASTTITITASYAGINGDYRYNAATGSYYWRGTTAVTRDAALSPTTAASNCGVKFNGMCGYMTIPNDGPESLFIYQKLGTGWIGISKPNHPTLQYVANAPSGLPTTPFTFWSSGEGTLSNEPNIAIYHSDGRWVDLSTQTYSPIYEFGGKSETVLFGVLTRTIAIGALVATGTPTLDSASDTGTSSSDKITNDNTPTINIGGLTSGATITLTATPASGPAVTCTFVASTTSGSCTFSTMLDGTYSITAKQSLGGTTTAASTALANVVIDATRPTVTLTSSQIVSGGNRTATQAAPGLTNQITATFSESVSGLLISEITKAASSTGWSITTTALTTSAITSVVFSVANLTGVGGTAGTLILSILEGVASDTAGNTNTATASNFVINTLIQLTLTNEYDPCCVIGGNNELIAQTTAGGAITLPGKGTLTRAGHTFAGWSLDKTGGNGTVLGATFTPTIPVKLYSSWIPDVYVVTYNANGGNGAPTTTSQNYTFGAANLALTTKGTLSRTGYTFAGWNTLVTGLGTNYLESASYKPTASITLFAKWTAGTFTLTYNANGGSTNSSTSITAGTPVTLSTNAGTRAGYTLAGWNTAADGSGTSYPGATSQTFFANTTLYGLWTPVKPGAPSVTATSAGNTTATVTVTGAAVSATTAGPATSYSIQTYANDGTTVIAGKTCTVLASASPLSCQITGLTNGTTYKFIATAINATGTTTGLISTVTAIPAPFVVTYFLNSGTLTPTTANFNLGTPLTLPLPTRSGFTFGGWYGEVGLTTLVGNDGASYSPTANTTLYAKWTGVVYTITYNGNGNSGGTVPASGSYTNGGTAYAVLDNTGVLVKTGYTFAGWYSNATGTGGSAYAAAASYSSASNITLFAKWDPVARTVTYNLGSGTGTIPTQLTGRFIGGTFSTAVSSGFTRSGFAFAGWSDGTNIFAANSTYTVGGADVVLTAQWTAVSYSVTFLSNGATSGTAPTQANLTAGQTFTTPTNPFTKTGFNFAGWNDGTNSYAPSATYTMTAANTVLVAQWAARGYAITYDGNTSTGGSVPTAGNFVTGSPAYSVALNTFTKTGHVFTGWRTTADATGTSYAPGAGYANTVDVVLYAQWAAASYTITYNGNGANNGTAPTKASESWTYSATTPLTLSTQGTLAKTGFTFGGWATTAGATVGDSSASPTANSTYYAVWTPTQFTVTYAPGTGATGTITSPGNKTFGQTFILDSGSSLTPPAANGNVSYSFGYWSDGTKIFNGGATYVMPADNILLTANWIAIFNVTYNPNGGTTTNASVQLADTNPLTIGSAATRTGYTFVKWQDQSGALWNPGETTTVTSTRFIFSAQWSANNNTITYNGNSNTGGSVPTTGSYVTDGAPYAVLGNTGSLVRAGYTFVGWNTAANGSGTDYPAGVGATYSLPDNVILYAKWQPGVYTITYNGNGATGGATPSNGTFTTGSSYSIPANSVGNLVKAGFTFAGWSTESNAGGTSYADAATTLTTTGDVILYAKWSAASYAVTYVLNGATSSLPTQSNVQYGSTFTLAAAAMQTDKNFIGWSDGTNTYGGGATYTMGTAAVTLTASWQDQVYAITYALNGGSGSAPVQSGLATGGTFTVATTTSTKSGYTFSGWDNGTTTVSAGSTYTMTANNVTLTAVWTIAAPASPSNVSAVGGDGSATITVAASSSGGSPTSYVVTASPGTGTCTVISPATSCVILGLTNGTAYTFSATATNSTGTATGTASSSITPAGKPDAPTGVNAVSGNGSATVSFTAPTVTGGPAIASYTVTASPNGATCTVNAPATSCVVPGLTNGTAYTFAVTANNGLFTSSASSASSSVVPATVPGAPTSVSASSTASGSATVTFTAPASNGGSTITGYTVTSSPTGATCSGSGTTYTCTGLTDGTAYTFAVVAVNSVGNSVAGSSSTALTTQGAASAPTTISAVTGDSKATVTFSGTAANGSTITGYTVKAYDSTGNEVSGVSCTVTTAATNASCEVTGLTNGSSYTFKAITNSTANSAAVSSAPSTATTAIVPAKAPDAPTGVEVTAGTGKISVSWTEPASNGSSITSYTVQAYDGSGAAITGATCTVNAPATTCDVSTNLVAGTNYTFKVTATSLAGTSVASTASTSIAVNAAPSVPINVTAVAGNASANISWDPPVNINGSALTGYSVTAYTAGNVVSGSCTTTASVETCLIIGLTNGTAYTFVVTATNGIGTSLGSTASSAVTPSTVPNAPTGVSAAVGDAEATISFTAPVNNGGSTVTGYTVTASNGSTVSGTSSPIKISGLTNATAYTFTVKATNKNGDSVASSASTAVTPVASSIPTLANDAQPTGNPYVGSTLTAAVTFNGSPTPTITYQWKVCDSPTDLGSCTNISGATSATYVPTISEVGKYIVVDETATNRVGELTETSAPTQVINPEVTFTGPSGTQFATVGTPVVISLAAAGGVGSYTYTVSAGTMPAGVSLDPNTGQISGAPTTAGTYTFTVRAADSNGVFKEAVVTITVAAAPTAPVVAPTPVQTCDAQCQADRAKAAADASTTKAAADKAAADAIAKAAADKAAADKAAAAKIASDTAATTASTKATADAAAAAAAAKAAVEKAAAAAVAQAAADAAARTAAAQAKAAADAQAIAAKAAADAAAALRNSTATAAAKAAATRSANTAAAEAAAAVRAAATAAQQAAQTKTAAANANKQVDIAINSLNSRTAASQASAQANAIAAAAKAAANEAAAQAASAAATAKATATAAQKAAADTAARIATEQKEAADAASRAKIAADAAAKATADKIAATEAARVAAEASVKILNEKAALAEQAVKATTETAREEINKKIEEVSAKAEEAQKAAEVAATKADAAVEAQTIAAQTAESATKEAQTQAAEAVAVKSESVTKTTAAAKAAAAATVAAKVATAAKAAAAKVPSKATIIPKPSTATNKNSATATVTGLKPGQKVKVTVNVKPKP
jgi:uncharacterized repeat protein (TIGR02543 family)